MRLVPSERFIAFPPSLAARIGVEETLVLCEINYRMGRDVDGGLAWVPATVKNVAEWLPFLSDRTIRRVILALRERGLIEIETRGYDRSRWMRVCRDHPLLDDQVTETSIASGQIGHLEPAKLATSKRPDWPIVLEEKNKKKKEEEVRKRTHRCPDGFEVTPEMRRWAAESAPGVDVERETAAFRDHEFVTPRSDWPAAWRNWMRKAKPSQQARPARGPATDAEIAAARRAAAEANQRQMERLNR